MTTSAGIDYFARSVRDRLFVRQAEGRQRLGAEIEVLPLLAESGLPCPLEPREDEGRNALSLVRAHGADLGWRERRSSKGAPYFELPNGSTLTFEPGGQLELCTPPTESVSRLVREARATMLGLHRAAADSGIHLPSVGIDPLNEIDAVPLQLHSARYERMTRYFDSIGPSGVRMMRQTAATQVSLDPGPDPAARWRLLADLTPYLTAMFANSARYAGQETGYRSFRARCWRLLDSSRTGIPHPALPACEAYTQFALDAVDMMRTTENGAYRAFGDWAADGQRTDVEWEDHLSTLFPEVRPRGYLEVRSIDALAPEVFAAPLVLLAGLIYDAAAARDARHLVPVGDEEMLNRAARCGLHDPQIGSVAADLVVIGSRGARALGDNMVSGPELEEAQQFFGDFTLRRRSPADGR